MIKKITTNLNYKNNIICFNNNIKSGKNSNPDSIYFNIYPLSRDDSKIYIRKKSSNMTIKHNINNRNINLITRIKRSTIGRHKKIILFLEAVIILKDTAKKIN